MDDGRISVRITIADRIYPLKIAMESEENLRKAANIINSEIEKYMDFPDRDIQDKLAVSALYFVVKLLDLESLNNDKSLFSEIEKLGHELGFYLEKQSSLENIE